MQFRGYIVGLGFAVICSLVVNVRADSMSEEQLLAARRHLTENDPTKHLPAVTGEDSSVTCRPASLLADSDVVCFGPNATLIPKRAILLVPKIYRERIKMQPGARLQSWREFYTANRSWIMTVEVSLKQAEGKEPIADPIKNQMDKSGSLVVATYLGGPISILPLKVPTKEEIQKSQSKPKS